MISILNINLSKCLNYITIIKSLIFLKSPISWNLIYIIILYYQIQNEIFFIFYNYSIQQLTPFNSTFDIFNKPVDFWL